MLLSTTHSIEGKRIVKQLGIVRGNTIRGVHAGRDIMATLRNLIGGEITDYTRMLGESREQALDRMTEEARNLGANAVIGVKFATSMVMVRAAEMLAYGTAVVVEDDRNNKKL